MAADTSGNAHAAQTENNRRFRETGRESTDVRGIGENVSGTRYFEAAELTPDNVRRCGNSAT